MPRPPHSRTLPPVPKERPTSLAASGPLSAPPPPDTAGSRSGDMVGFWVFTALIALGLVAAVRAFLTM